MDVFAQLSAFRATWLKLRSLLLVVGIAVAAILTRIVSLGLFFLTSCLGHLRGVR